jgi:multisubunit Na+/H+ antiporter MnhF subunit
MVAAAYAASALLSSLGLAAMLFSRRQRGGVMRLRFVEFLLRDQRLFTAIVLGILAFIAYFVMRSLARSLASPQLERLSRMAFALLAVSAAFCLAIYVSLGVYRIRPGPLSPEPVLSALDACMGVVGVFMGCYWIYVARLVREHARKIPAVVPTMSAPGAALGAEEKVAQFLGVRARTIS